MATGADLFRLAQQHVGEIYRNVLVPKDDPDWHGPWDCAEFASWVVYQASGRLYGCDPRNQNPRTTEAFTGYWEDDVRRLGDRVSVEDAAGTVGGIVLRYPPAPGSMGHIALCDGRGGTVEAKGRAYGVVRDEVHGRPWDTGVLIPGIEYDPGIVPITPPTHVYAVRARGMNRDVVKHIQEALARVKTGSNPDRYLNPGPIDGLYGPHTAAAVYAFQEIAGLITDGQVGPQTAAALGISLGQPTIAEILRGGGPAAGAPFSIDTNLKTTPSPLTAAKIRSFFEHQTEGRNALKDIGDAVMEASAKYGINATYMVAHAILESSWGRSQIARTKHNLFGWQAHDEDPGQAKSFASAAECIDFVMGRINELYPHPGGQYYDTAPCLGNKRYGMNKRYASDPDWGEDIASIARRIEREV
jgi:Mannosyl-glycoprotein endo-beta-N-acetylglucosaminidase/Putative peptidoglycan binding domain